MKKKTLYVDMDGVSCNLDDYMHTIMPGIPLCDGPDFQERSKIFTRAVQQNPDVFLRLKPMPGAIKRITNLMGMYDVYFLSTPMDTHFLSYTHKREWLERYFGGLADKKLILTHRKDLQIGDYIVDDTTRNGVSEFTGEHLHFGTEKFPDWETTYNYLLAAYNRDQLTAA